MTSEDQGQYLVIDYLTGNMEPGDTENLKRWLSESEANRDYFRDMKDVWFSVVCDSEYEFDAERAYGEFLERIDNKKRKEKVARRGVRIRRVVRYTAAAVTRPDGITVSRYRRPTLRCACRLGPPPT